MGRYAPEFTVCPYTLETHATTPMHLRPCTHSHTVVACVCVCVCVWGWLCECDIYNILNIFNAKYNQITVQQQVFALAICTTVLLLFVNFSVPFLGTFLMHAVVTGFETENKYKVRNSLGQQVYFATEGEYAMKGGSL